MARFRSLLRNTIVYIFLRGWSSSSEGPFGEEGTAQHSTARGDFVATTTPTMSVYQDGKFLLIWSIASLLTAGLPLAVFSGARLANDGDSSAARQQEYDENNEHDQYKQASQYQYSNGCYWWQWGCDEGYQAQNAQELENLSPWWWVWSEDERRKQNTFNPTVLVIYIWTIVVLFAITTYGRRTVMSGGSLYGVAVTCLMYANYSFVSMLFIGGLQGAVRDDSANLGDNGWYGQVGVLLYLTNLTSTIFGLTYFFAFRRLAAEKEITRVDVAPSDYMNYNYQEPTKIHESV